MFFHLLVSHSCDPFRLQSIKSWMESVVKMQWLIYFYFTFVRYSSSLSSDAVVGVWYHVFDVSPGICLSLSSTCSGWFIYFLMCFRHYFFLFGEARTSDKKHASPTQPWPYNSNRKSYVTLALKNDPTVRRSLSDQTPLLSYVAQPGSK